MQLDNTVPDDGAKPRLSCLCSLYALALDPRQQKLLAGVGGRDHVKRVHVILAESDQPRWTISSVTVDRNAAHTRAAVGGDDAEEQRRTTCQGVLLVQGRPFEATHCQAGLRNSSWVHLMALRHYSPGDGKDR